MSDERKSGSNTTLIVVVVILGILVLGCGGLGAAFFFLSARVVESVSTLAEQHQAVLAATTRLEALAAGADAEALADGRTGPLAPVSERLVAEGRIAAEELLDPWGRPYVFEKSEATGWDVYSVGEDGIPDTEDDIGRRF